MTEDRDKKYSLVNLGNMAEPAKVLIEKISDAVGGIFKPYQIKRVAQAEAEADRIKALAKIEISELEERTLHRLLSEEAVKQENIESITKTAIPLLEEQARPANIKNDWLVDFFDKSRLVSDNQMQELWARILAGEANSPGMFSRKTIHLVDTLEQADAALFNKLCDFIWVFNQPTVLIFDTDAEIYKKHHMSFSALKHLDSIGLISFESFTGYIKKGFPKEVQASYKDNKYSILFPKESGNEIRTGHVMLTSIGIELANICGSKKVEGFEKYVIEELGKDNVLIKRI